MVNEDHGQANAKAWLENIVEMVDALTLAELDEDDRSGCPADEARQRIQESVLSVEVRSDWVQVANWGRAHNDQASPSEYRICLTTGGPAAQIVGELSEYGEPETARLEYQDWFKPWTVFAFATEDQRTALLTFVRCFYFGE